MRKEYFISVNKELKLIESLSIKVTSNGFDANNTSVVTVSSDYSSIVGQLMRHNLSYKGEIADGFSVDVPYPDQEWDLDFINNLKVTMNLNLNRFQDKTLLLVENGVIRGGNYTFLKKWININYPNVNVKTLTLFENIHSVFKSDFVGQFYDDKIQDLTFKWEHFNNHWN
jgi:hypothetical protein